MRNSVCIETEEFDMMEKISSCGAVRDGEVASEGDKVR
jgi:hypothetical protein